MTSGNPAQGRQRIHVGVTTLAWLNIYQNLKQIIQDAIAPEIQSIKGEIKGLQTQIRALELQVSGLRADFRSFQAHTEKRFDEQNRQWEIAMDIRERLAALEAQIKSR
jgi:predicted  nucleic acid-binding Zn-ribbon protein